MSRDGLPRPPEEAPEEALGLGNIRRVLARSSFTEETGAPGDFPTEPGTRQAAVALVLRTRAREADISVQATPRATTELLLIRRAEHELDPWSGHMALPGGRKDPEDSSLLDTARRETLEEVGLDLAKDAELIGRLPTVPAMARGRRIGMSIAPFVFALRGEPALAANYEVAEVVWASLQLISSGTVDTSVTYEGQEAYKMTLPGWDISGRIVWGLTYHMVSTLLRAARDGAARGSEEQP